MMTNEELYKLLEVDAERYGNREYKNLETGFVTFAYHNNVCIAVDVCYLTKHSLIRWLHFKPNRAVNMVLMRLEHMPVGENPPDAKNP